MMSITMGDHGNSIFNGSGYSSSLCCAVGWPSNNGLGCCCCYAMLRKTSNFEKGKGERMKPDYVVYASFMSVGERLLHLHDVACLTIFFLWHTRVQESRNGISPSQVTLCGNAEWRHAGVVDALNFPVKYSLVRILLCFENKTLSKDNHTMEM